MRLTTRPRRPPPSPACVAVSSASPCVATPNNFRATMPLTRFPSKGAPLLGAPAISRCASRHGSLIATAPRTAPSCTLRSDSGDGFGSRRPAGGSPPRTVLAHSVRRRSEHQGQSCKLLPARRPQPTLRRQSDRPNPAHSASRPPTPNLAAEPSRGRPRCPARHRGARPIRTHSTQPSRHHLDQARRSHRYDRASLARPVATRRPRRQLRQRPDLLHRLSASRRQRVGALHHGRAPRLRARLIRAK